MTTDKAKFIQIATCSVSADSTPYLYALYALDEHGAVWVYDDSANERTDWGWRPLVGARLP